MPTRARGCIGCGDGQPPARADARPHRPDREPRALARAPGRRRARRAAGQRARPGASRSRRRGGCRTARRRSARRSARSGRRTGSGSPRPSRRRGPAGRSSSSGTAAARRRCTAAAAPVQGLVKGGGYDRTTAPLGTPSGRVELELEMACNDLMGLPDPFPLRRDRTGRTWQEPTDDRSLRAPRAPARLARAGLALLDTEAWDMAWDLEALRQLSDEPGLDPAWAGRLLAELDRFARTWVAGDRATWPEARAILGDLLAHRNAGSAHDVTAIGHAHIDTAWLWPLAETRRKIVRSWSSQLALMDRYPEHRFAASSAQHYAWLEQDAPALYERLRDARAGGPLGGGRRLVGGARPQPALRRVARAPGRLRPARPAGALRRALPRVLDPGHVRLQRPGPADPARRRDRPLPHPEALLEPVHRAAAPLVRVGGDRRLARCSCTCRRPTPTTPS